MRAGGRGVAAATAADRAAGDDELGEDAGEFGLPEGLLVAGDGGEAGEGVVEGRIQGAQGGKDLVAEPVAGEGQVGVGLVRLPGLVEGSKVSLDGMAIHREKRAKDAAGATAFEREVEDGEDAGQAFGPGTAQELHQDGLRLVVCGMGGGDGIRGAGGEEVAEGFVAEIAGGLFDGFGVGLEAGGGVDAAEDEGNGEVAAERFNELLVLIGGLAAEAVVDMDGGEAEAQGGLGEVVGGVEGAKKSDGVCAAGEGYGEAGAGGEAGTVEGELRQGCGHAVASLGGRRWAGRVAWYTRGVMRVYAILPAAGIGTRMAAAGVPAAVPKQFLEVGGVPILIHALRAFLAVARVDAVCLAVRGSERERMEAWIAEFTLGSRVHMVEGGDHRQESVSHALTALECDEDDVVLVHDAVRPLIDPATIERTIDAIVRHGAAIVGVPAVDTIKQVERTADGAIVTSTIPRERIVQAQTPQGARAGLLRRAFAEAETDGFAGTDEASLLERAGIEVTVVAGSPRNFKITQPGDLQLAEFYLEQMMAGVGAR